MASIHLRSRYKSTTESPGTLTHSFVKEDTQGTLVFSSSGLTSTLNSENSTTYEGSTTDQGSHGLLFLRLPAAQPTDPSWQSAVSSELTDVIPEGLGPLGASEGQDGTT